MLDLGFTCLCVYGDQCIIEAEQPAFMQGIWEVIGLSPRSPVQTSGHLHPLWSVPRSSWRSLGVARRRQGACLEASWRSWKASKTFQHALGRSGTVPEASRSSGTTREGSNTTPVMVWRLPPRPTAARQLHSDRPAQAHRTYKFNKITILISLQGL